VLNLPAMHRASMSTVDISSIVYVDISSIVLDAGNVNANVDSYVSIIMLEKYNIIWGLK
jgi:hypothetical protein